VPLEEFRFHGIFRENEPELAEILTHPRLLVLAEPDRPDMRPVSKGREIKGANELRSQVRPRQDLVVTKDVVLHGNGRR
jgi:hypothetical protein